MTTGKPQRCVWDQAARDADLTLHLKGGTTKLDESSG